MTAPEDDTPQEHPTLGHIDELLSDPPAQGIGGTLEGDASGRRLRVWFGSVVAAAFVLVVLAAVIYTRARANEPRAAPIPAYVTDGAPTRDEDRVLRWSSDGKARLGLTREPPGVHAIELPDRVLRLADGIDHAQVEVVIEHGETVAVRPLVGRVVVE